MAVAIRVGFMSVWRILIGVPGVGSHLRPVRPGFGLPVRYVVVDWPSGELLVNFVKE